MQSDMTDDDVVKLGDPGAEGAAVAEKGPGGTTEVGRVAIMAVASVHQPLAGFEVVISPASDRERPLRDGVAHAAIRSAASL